MGNTDVPRSDGRLTGTPNGSLDAGGSGAARSQATEEIIAMAIPYEIPESTPPERFAFGEYMFMAGEFLKLLTDGDGPVVAYALLGEGVQSVSEGRTYYDRLNDLYAMPSPRMEDAPGWLPSFDDADARRYLYDRHIIRLSPEADRVLCAGVHLDKDEKYSYWPGAMVVSEIFERESLLHSDEGEIHFEYGSFYNYSGNLRGKVQHDSMAGITYYFREFVDKEEMPVSMWDHGSTQYPVYNDDYTIYATWSEDGNICTCSFPDNNLVAEFFPQKKDPQARFIMHQVIDDGRILYSEEASAEVDANIEGVYYHYVLLYSTLFIASPDGTDVKELGNYMYSPILSPDGKYLAYRTPYGDENFVCDGDTEDFAQGVFIMNVETGEQTFFDIGKDSYPRMICWSRKTSIEALVAGA